MRRRPALSVASISALVLAGLAVPLAGAPTARADAPRTATLVGTLQDELGCSGDWQPDCTKTDLALVPGTSTYAAEFRVPAGSYELKVAINHSWDESYGQGSGNVPLVLAGPGHAALHLRRHDARRRRRTHRPARRCHEGRLEARGPVAAHASRRRSASTSSWPTASPTATRPTTSGGLTGGPLATGFDPTNEGFYHGGDLKGLTASSTTSRASARPPSGSPRRSRTAPSRAAGPTRAPATTATGSPTSRRSTRTSARTPT